MGQTIIYSIPFFGVLSLIYMFWKSAWVSRQEEGTPKMAAIAKGDFAGYLHPQLNAVPVNFLSSADTTGGNSGSAVMNGKGELVGLNFDSTYESITKDWYFNPEITRAIHVDIRYVLWLMEHVDGAQNLLEEMDIVR